MDKLLNREADVEVIVLNGTRLDVFEGLEFLVKDVGFVLSDIEGVIREPEDVETRHDINSGDFIIFDTPFDERLMVIGYDIGDHSRVNEIMNFIGHMLDLPQRTRIGVDLLYLMEDDELREIHNDMMKRFKESHADTLESLQHIYLIEATDEEFYKYVESERNRVGESKVHVNSVLSEDPNNIIEVETIEDINDGMFIIGQSESEDGVLQVGFIVVNVTDEQITEMLKETMSGINKDLYADKAPTVHRELFKDSRLSGVI